MARPLIVEFTKMNGAGNDFIVIDNRFYAFVPAELSAIAARYCPRRTGIGADGLLAYEVEQDSDAHFRMRYFNADGSAATMCGNGARCIVAFAHASGAGGPSVEFDTDAGRYAAEVNEGGTRVRLHVPAPDRYLPDHALESTAIPGNGQPSFIWTGTEHLVCFVDDQTQRAVSEWAPEVRNDDSLKPHGANINAVVVPAVQTDRARIDVRTFEKGVEQETLACGTGALASAVVARLQEKVTSDTIDVSMPGGTLTVGIEWSGKRISGLILEGPAEKVYRGTIELRLQELRA